jgi:hypothetical protein
MLPQRLILCCAALLAAAVPFLAFPLKDRAIAEVNVADNYTYNATDSPHSEPNAFVSDSPGLIDFDSNATLEAEVDFDMEAWESWKEWHADGANTDNRDDYDLAPLSALTLGSSGYNATLGAGARVVNTGESDGLTALGEMNTELKSDSLAHGSWSGIALENIAAGSLNSTIVNHGRIGSYMNEDGEEIESDFGIWLNKGGAEDVFCLENREAGSIEGEISGVHVVGGASAIRIRAGSNSTIDGGSTGISLGEVDPLAAWAMRPEAYHYYRGNFTLDSNATIKGDTTGIDIVGSGARLDITNRENATIEGGNTGIRYLDSGEGNAAIVNYGEISGAEAGIRISGASVDIEHYGAIKATGGDAMLLEQNVQGGEIDLYSGVQGDIRHLGESAEAVLFLRDANASDPADYSADDIHFGQGRIVQKNTNAATTWSLGEVRAGALLLQSGETEVSSEVSIEGDINATADSRLAVNGADIRTRNLRVRDNATLHFESGSIAIREGELDHSNAPLVLRGQSDDAIASLSLDRADVDVPTNATVRQHGRLSGTGRIHGGLTAANGTLQPGDPTGELEVGGTLNIQDNATVVIGIKGGEDNNGKIAAEDNATIGEASLEIRDTTIGEVRDGDTYTYLTASQTTGNFTEVVDNEPLYAFSPQYESDRAYFIADRLTDYSDKAETANQKRVARALESARKEGRLQSLVRAWEDLLADIEQGDAPASKMRKALDQMSPEPYQAAFRMTARQASEMFCRTMRSARRSRLKMETSGQEPGALLGSSPALAVAEPNALNRVLGAISDLGRSIAGLGGTARIDPDEKGVSAPGSEWRGFYGLYHRQGDVDSGSSRTGQAFRSTGLITGAERNVGSSLTAGGSLGYVRSSVDFDGSRGKLETNSFRLGSHATYFRDPLEVDVAASAGAHFHRQKRRMTVPETLVATSRYTSYDGSLHAGARYRGTPARNWALIPSGSMQYTHHYREKHTEDGAGDARLEFESQSERSLRSNLQLSLGRQISGEGYVLLPEVFAGWRRELLKEDMKVEASFAGAPESGFRVVGDGPGRGSLNYGLGITALFWDYNVGFVRYERERLEEGGASTLSAGVKWNF